LIWRIRDRDAFARLSAQGRRVGSGVLWCTFLLDQQATPPRVAFAIGRAYGPAVARNRLRRRLRALLTGAPLPAGWFLIGARPTAARRSFDELAFDMQRLIDQIGPASCSG
jgi:ribonuclease P protein component